MLAGKHLHRIHTAMSRSSCAVVLVFLLAVATANVQAQDASVIIIGSGISGIAAARRLISNNVTSVLVLEARTRPGGRLYSVKVGGANGAVIDLGGAWIQGTKDNPLLDLAEQYQLPLAPATRQDNTIYWTDGSEATEEQLTPIYEVQNSFYSYLEAAQEGAEGFNINSTIQDVWNRWLTTEPAAEDDRTRLTVRQLLNGDIEQEYAASFAQLSALYFNQDEGLGGQSVLWKTGYSSLIAELAKGISILYNQSVVSVDYSQSPVIIKTAGGKTYSAPYVISTIPLGVLKSPYAPKFIPAFSGKKADAIAKLGVGLLNKVVLVFKEAFWGGADADWIYYIPPNPGAYSTLLSCSNALGKPVLIFLVAGEFAWKTENKTTAQILSDVYVRLRTMFPKTYQPPISTRVTKWGRQPFSYGSYPFIQAGAARDAYTAMSEPLLDRLFFAGDATSQDYPATAHGAYWSGQREADRIMKLAGSQAK